MALAIRKTDKYEIFKLTEFNRDVEKTKLLEQSMRENGWIDAYPMHVIKNKWGFKIKAGHRRFDVAKKLGIPVKFVVCEDTATVHDLERSTKSWSLFDYMVSYVRCGRHPYVVVKEYYGRTGIPLTGCISMLGGQSAGSGNLVQDFKDGTYQLGDPEHATIVADIVLHCKQWHIPFAAHNHFVSAISKLVRVEILDVKLLKQKVKTYPYIIDKRPNIDGYLAILDVVYNTRNKTKIPLVFLANEIARERSRGAIIRK